MVLNYIVIETFGFLKFCTSKITLLYWIFEYMSTHVHTHTHKTFIYLQVEILSLKKFESLFCRLGKQLEEIFRLLLMCRRKGSSMAVPENTSSSCDRVGSVDSLNTEMGTEWLWVGS